MDHRLSVAFLLASSVRETEQSYQRQRKTGVITIEHGWDGDVLGLEDMGTVHGITSLTQERPKTRTASKVTGKAEIEPHITRVVLGTDTYHITETHTDISVTLPVTASRAVYVEELGAVDASTRNGEDTPMGVASARTATTRVETKGADAREIGGEPSEN